MGNIRDHVRALLTGDDEAKRLSDRGPYKAKKAKAAAAEQAMLAINQQQRELEGRKELEIQKRESKAAPKKARLAGIRDEIEDLLLAGKDVPPTLATEAAALEGEIAALAVQLDATIKGIDAIIKKLAIKKKALAIEVSEGAAARSALASRKLADPQLLLEKFATEQARVWAGRRREAADHEYQRAIANLNTQRRERESHAVRNSQNQVVKESEPSAHEARLERDVEAWGHELETAEREYQSAEIELQKIRQQIIDE